MTAIKERTFRQWRGPRDGFNLPFSKKQSNNGFAVFMFILRIETPLLLLIQEVFYLIAETMPFLNHYFVNLFWRVFEDVLVLICYLQQLNCKDVTF